VPLFQQQIEAGGPVTLTHRDMTRYFMSIHEAVELIVQAGALSQGGDIFLLEMGEPIRIAEVAASMIRLAGLTLRSPDNPGGDMEVAVIGPRPGEKLNEELFYDAEHAMATGHPKIFRELRNGLDGHDVRKAVARLTTALKSGDEAQVRAALFGFLEA
jgi:FlaA1/EpsC-like NDP-sugar epimerase